MYLLGYDLGSSSIKAAIVEAESGKTVAIAKFPSIEMNIIATQKEFAEQNPDLWWEYVCETTKTVLAKANIDKTKIKAIGIAYQMHGLVCVDENQEVIRNAIIWCDSRAVNIGNQAFEAIGEEKCLKNLLNSPANFTASKLAWIKANEPENYAKIHKIMLPGDFIAMKMCGEITTTISGLSEGVFWDFQKNEISKDVLNHYGFNENIFPNIKDTFSIQGKLTENAAKKLGLPPNIPITYRAGDQPNNALSLNVLNNGEVAATGGTSGVVYAVTDKPIFDLKSRVNAFAHVNYSIDNQRIGVLLCINGAGILNSWLKQIVGKDLSYEAMNFLANQIPIGSDDLIILPFGNGAERVLENKNIGSHIINLNFNQHTNAHLFRAGLEGIAFAFVYGINILKEMGLEINVLKVGNDNLFQSNIFRETIATLVNCTIEIIETTGAIGAAKAAGVGVGIYKNIEAAMKTVTVLKIVKPNLEKENYQKAYERWEKALRQFL
jgi:xylulokinase